MISCGHPWDDDEIVEREVPNDDYDDDVPGWSPEVDIAIRYYASAWPSIYERL